MMSLVKLSVTVSAKVVLGASSAAFVKVECAKTVKIAKTSTQICGTFCNTRYCKISTQSILTLLLQSSG